MIFGFLSHNLIYWKLVFSSHKKKIEGKKNFLIQPRKNNWHILNFEKPGREYLSPWSPLKKCLLGNTSKCGLHHIVSKNILNNQIIK